ncbi:ADAM-10, putative, partial [Ixodes scapularis]
MASVIDCGKFLNRFVLHYEPLSYEPISANHTQARRKRSLEQGHERVLLTFHAHSRRFRLSLINDRSAFSDELIIITSAGPVKASLDHLYSGYLIGVDFHARSPWMTGSPGNEERQQKVKRVCNLEINIDHTLYNAVLLDSHLDPGKTQESLIAMLTSHVTAASDMFRNTDFLGIADISFEIQRVLINNSESCDADKRATNPFCASDLDSAHMLHELSKINHDDFCLSYLWTYRDFVGGTLGLAYKAEPNGESGFIHLRALKGKKNRSNNNRATTSRTLPAGMHPLSEPITFTHELGHNFGSPHDFPPECVPGSIVGNYIMYESATHGNLPNNRKFSPCSVRNVSLVLHQLFSGDGPRANCLQ